MGPTLSSFVYEPIHTAMPSWAAGSDVNAAPNATGAGGAAGYKPSASSDSGFDPAAFSGYATVTTPDVTFGPESVMTSAHVVCRGKRKEGGAPNFELKKYTYKCR